MIANRNTQASRAILTSSGWIPEPYKGLRCDTLSDPYTTLSGPHCGICMPDVTLTTLNQLKQRAKRSLLTSYERPLCQAGKLNAGVEVILVG